MLDDTFGSASNPTPLAFKEVGSGGMYAEIQ
jgi:hypothetical protein